MMRFASLGSGSKGNGTLVEGGDFCLLVDCGFSVRDTERRLRRLGRKAEDLGAILVTHEHNDHLRGVLPLARKYCIPVVMTHGTARRASLRPADRVDLINPHEVFNLGSFEILPVAVPHDAVEPVQYIFSCGARRLGILTDLGSISASVAECFNGCDALLLEANHDPGMLQCGVYPPSLKRRVGGDWGHLSNSQAAGLLSVLEKRKIQTLVLGHISQQNNTTELVADAVIPHIEEIERVVYACQESGFPWFNIE